MGFHSDTAYDSIGTSTTMNSKSDLPGLEIERLFDDIPAPAATKQSLLPLEELIPRGSFSELSQHDGTSLDGLDSLSTPRDDHSSNSENLDCFATPVAVRDDQSRLGTSPSSPPSTPYSKDLDADHGPIELISAETEGLALRDNELWDHGAYPRSTSKDEYSSPELPQHSSWRLSPPLLGAHQRPPVPHQQGFDGAREEKRLSIFDWSEQQRSDRDSLYGSSPRPRTVHSKQNNDGRGGRAPGRRAPNALHLRSQSVPAPKESYLDSNPSFPPTKFGTWGLGNKGVSEEWTDDFEFDEVDECETQHSSDRVGTGMKVPQAIIDRQASVHGQFGQVQEFMLLVEELKRLRHQGTLLDLMGGPSNHLWDDAENIINLATLNEEEEEEEEDLVPPQSPSFSNGFDDFDEISSPAQRLRQQYLFGTGDESTTAPGVTLNSAPATLAAGRPRGESLAQAKSFLQTMHKNRVGVESSPFADRNPPPKLPFDTQDLRDLVTRAGIATRALKDIVRKAEGVFTSPVRTPKEPQDPPFSQIFNRPENASPTSKKPCLVKSTSVNSYINGSLASSNNERERPGHMNMMTVV